MDNTLEKLCKHTFHNPAFHSSLQPSLFKSKKTLQALKNKFDEFTDAWLDILKYFGEDPNDYVNVVADEGKRVPEERRRQPVYVFVSLDLFFQAFKDAVNQHREEEKRRKAKERRYSQRQRGLSTASSASPSRGQSGESISSSVTLVKAKLGQSHGESSRTIFKSEESVVNIPSSAVNLEESSVAERPRAEGGDEEEDLESFAAIFDSTESLPFAPEESVPSEERVSANADKLEAPSRVASPLRVATGSDRQSIPPRISSSSSKRQRRPSSSVSSSSPSSVVKKTSTGSVSKLRKDKALQRLSKEYQNFSKAREVDIDNVSRSFTDQILMDAAQGKVLRTGVADGESGEELSPESVIKRYSMSSLALMDSEALDALKGSISKEGLGTPPQDLERLGSQEKVESVALSLCPKCQMEKEVACECSED